MTLTEIQKRVVYPYADSDPNRKPIPSDEKSKKLSQPTQRYNAKPSAYSFVAPQEEEEEEGEE
jgi:hypothetical protein